MNPMKNYFVRAKGNKSELLKALRNLIELIEENVETEEHTIQGTIWSWKEDQSGEMTADLKVL